MSSVDTNNTQHGSWSCLPLDIFTRVSQYLSEADIHRAREACSTLRYGLGDDIEEITTTCSPTDQQAWHTELYYIRKLAPRLRQLIVGQKLTPCAAQRLSTLASLTRLTSLRIANGQLLRDQSVVAIAALQGLTHLQIHRAAQLSSRALDHLRALLQLRSLDLKECHNISWGAFQVSHEQELQQGADGVLYLPNLLPGLNSLTITCSNAFATQPLLEAAAIASLSNVTELELQRCNLLTDTAMEQLGGMQQLQRLKLAGLWSVTDKGIACLSRLQNLSSLALVQPAKASGEGLLSALAPLAAGLTSLQLLGLPASISSCRLRALLASTQRLQALELAAPSACDSLLEAIAALPRLQALQLSGSCQLTSAGMAALPHAAGLRQLRLQECYGVSASAVVAQLPFLPCLDSLSLNNITFAPFEHTEQQPEPEQQQQQRRAALRVLELECCPFLCDSQLMQIARLCPALSSLSIGAADEVSDRGLSQLACLRQLQQLRLAGCQVDGSFAEQLAALPLLAEVCVAGSEVLGDQGCASLAGLHGLRKLGVAGCLEVGAEGVACLMALPHLRELDCTGCSSSAVLRNALAAAPTHVRVLQ